MAPMRRLAETDADIMPLELHANDANSSICCNTSSSKTAMCSTGGSSMPGCNSSAIGSYCQQYFQAAWREEAAGLCSMLVVPVVPIKCLLESHTCIRRCKCGCITNQIEGNVGLNLKLSLHGCILENPVSLQVHVTFIKLLTCYTCLVFMHKRP